MARYSGRVIIAKVDEFGKKIKDFKGWRAKNPDSLYFDSTPEWAVWDYLRSSGIKFKYQPSIDLFDTVDTEEFEQPRQTKKAKTEKNNVRIIKSVKQRPIGFTPDFYLSDLDVYIEVKGWADEVFKLRWKLFKLKGYKGFIIYSVDEFKQLYTQLNSGL